MLIHPQIVFENETSIVQIFDDAHLLPYWRMGIVSTRDGKPGVNSAGSYRIVVAYAALRKRGPFDFVHRVAYLNCAGAPDHFDGIDADYESDNLLTPASFVAGRAETEETTNFGLSLGGPATVLNEWRQRIISRKDGCDAYCRSLGIAPAESGIERWGKTYSELNFDKTSSCS